MSKKPQMGTHVVQQHQQQQQQQHDQQAITPLSGTYILWHGERVMKINNMPINLSLLFVSEQKLVHRQN
jgi:hypothetical protein